MERYEVIIPLDYFRLIVTTDAHDVQDARRAAIDLVTNLFPLVVNRSDEFKMGGCVVGHPQSVRKAIGY